MQSFFLIFLHIPKIHPYPIPSHPNILSKSLSPFTHTITCPFIMRFMWAILIIVGASLIHHAHHGPSSSTPSTPSCSSWAIHSIPIDHDSFRDIMSHPHPGGSRWIPKHHGPSSSSFHPSRWILIRWILIPIPIPIPHPMGRWHPPPVIGSAGG